MSRCLIKENRLVIFLALRQVAIEVDILYALPTTRITTIIRIRIMLGQASKANCLMSLHAL